MPQYFSFNPTQPNATHGWTQPMSISVVGYMDWTELEWNCPPWRMLKTPVNTKDRPLPPEIIVSIQHRVTVHSSVIDIVRYFFQLTLHVGEIV